MTLVPLAPEHQTVVFDCGEDKLNAWLNEKALRNQSTGASRTFVIAKEQRVIAYYALASSSLRPDLVSAKARRNKPDPIPVILLGRMAVDREFQRLGLGYELFRDAAKRCLLISEMADVCAMIVHAKSQAVRSYYLKLGFEEAKSMPMLLYVRMSDLRVLFT